jgi:Asp-tRNA(Asn)/Glu-tRNA(Gln) amidotransferase C subunit
VYERLLAEGVRLSRINVRHLRAVAHLDVTRAQIEEAAAVLARVIGNRGPR